MSKRWLVRVLVIAVVLAAGCVLLALGSGNKAFGECWCSTACNVQATLCAYSAGMGCNAMYQTTKGSGGGETTGYYLSATQCARVYFDGDGNGTCESAGAYSGAKKVNNVLCP
jgi:hypothetical protein